MAGQNADERTNIEESGEAGDVLGDKHMALQWIPPGIDIGTGPYNAHVTGRWEGEI